MTTRVPINLREVSYSLSDALDLVGIDDVQHGKRVTFMAAACLRTLDAPQDVYDNVVHAAMIHDCGVSSSGLHKQLIDTFEWTGKEVHCIKGAELLAQCGPLSQLSPIVRHHHTRWEQLKDTDIDEVVALQANCIYLVDRVDALMAQHRSVNPLVRGTEVRREIAKHAGIYFNPELVEAFLETSAREAFWFTMMDNRINDYLQGWLRRGIDEHLDLREIRCIARIYAEIVDTKSPYTAEHSFGVANLAWHLGRWQGLDRLQCDKLELAGLLHDIGKLRVPDDILEKPAALNEEEKAIMARHSYDAYLILGSITGLEEIARWAALHHEKPSGGGYPFHTSGKELPLEARILAVADVFQALAQQRPYREAMDLKGIADILTAKTANNELDTEIVDLAISRIDECRDLALNPKSYRMERLPYSAQMQQAGPAQ